MILLGDTHLGKNNFNREVCKNQINYLKKIIDIASEDDKQIFQLGDVFDHRTTTDIFFLGEVKKLFEYLKTKEVKLYTLLGNHDVYFRETRDVSLVSHFSHLYPDNFIVYDEKGEFKYKDKKILIVPWLVKGEDLKAKELKDFDAVFGHFEIRGFEVVKGHIDEKSVLSESFFKKANCPCFSGHYHSRSVREYVKYLGTPYPLDWGAFSAKNGYYVLDEDLNLEFFENEDIDYPKYVKLLYDDSAVKPLLIQGLKKDILCDFNDFKNNIDILKNHNLKFFVNKANDTRYEEYMYILNQNSLVCPFVNNQTISDLIDTNYVEDDNNLQNIKPSKELIIDFIKENKPEVLDVFLELLNEIQTKE